MRFLKLLWKKWLEVAHAIGNFQGQAILTFFYLILISPLAIFFQLVSDPFGVRKKLKSNFKTWDHPRESLDSARKPF